MKYASPDGAIVHIVGDHFILYSTRIFESWHLKEVFRIAWSINQLRNRILLREMNFQLNLRHSPSHHHNSRRRRCHCHYFPRHAPPRIWILSYFSVVFFPLQSRRRSEPCMLFVCYLYVSHL